MTTVQQLRQRLRNLHDPEAARVLQRFFKTGPGEYGEGDRFLGIRVPVLRKLAREYAALSLADISDLLRSPVHEERLLALLLLVRAYARADSASRDAIYRLYLSHTRYINNWDLVDASAEHIVGAHLRERDRRPLEQLARSDLLWERRIAIMATFHLLRRVEFDPSLRVAELLLAATHDLIHKAVGWMLREVGKRDPAAEEEFLRKHYRGMPRTMLRYAIEKFPERARQQYLRGEM